MDSSRTGQQGFTPEEREELQDLRAEDLACEASGHAPAAEKIERRMELDARERKEYTASGLRDAARGLRTIRSVALGLSLRSVADSAGLTHVRLGEIERGALDPATPGELRAICRALGAV